MNTAARFMNISAMTPMERLAHALDTMEDQTLLAPFQAILDDYEDFLAAKSHSELDTPSGEQMLGFSEKAQRLDDLLHAALASTTLDRSLVRYVLI